jgi:hypothetical protein
LHQRKVLIRLDLEAKDKNLFIPVFTQLVWLKIDCTHYGSPKGICKKFFTEVDKAIVTSYLKEFGNKTQSVDV